MTRVVRTALWLGLVTPALVGQIDPLASLRKAHPRLMALDSDIERVRGLVQRDSTARRVYDRLAQEARDLEAAPTVQYQLAGPRLLGQSTRCLDRVYTLALVYRMTGDRQYADRAMKELRAAAAFPNWNPSHFLDTAEMTHAFAIGYDWLYPILTAADRKLLQTAIVEKGLKEALPIYEGRRPYPDSRLWATMNHNWNLVCNGGIVLGALAIAEETPDMSRTVLRQALKSAPYALASYAPDGGWAEGPGYWHYATRYAVNLMAGLQTALESDFGLSASAGFDRAGHFQVYFSGPAGKTFNYADAGEGDGAAVEMFWLAKRFSQPVYAWQQQSLLKRTSRPAALDLVWYQAEAKSPEQAEWPLNACFEGASVAFLRSSWSDPHAIFVGIKGGDNAVNHGHLDLGSFVLDAGGVRWALDLGADDYNLPDYFDWDKGGRWQYYRLRTESHNTVLLDGENQAPEATAPIMDCGAKADPPYVLLDLSRAYPAKVNRYQRRLALLQRRAVLIQDVIEAKRPVEPLWGMVTDAVVSIQGRKAELEKGEWALSAEVLSPNGATFAVVSTTPPKPQRQNEGTRKLVVRLPEKVSSLDLKVLLTPHRSGGPKSE